MKLLNTTILAFIAVSFLVSHTSCKKETDTFDFFPISITSVDTLGGTKISWTKFESSDFIEYVLVKSSKDSITDFSNLNTNGGAFILSRTSNVKQTEFIDISSANFTSKLYYRVFIRLKNRTLSSANYTLNSDLTPVDFSNINELVQDENNPNIVYLYSSNNGQLVAYDLNKDSIVARSSPRSGISRTVYASNNGANSEIVQVSAGIRKLYFLDAKTLELKATLDFSYYMYNVTSSNDGYVCVLTDEYNKQFQLVRLSDHKVVSVHPNVIENYSYYSGTLLTKIPNNNSILVVENSSNPNIGKLNYDPQGNFLPSKIIGRTSNNFSSNLPVKISSKGTYFLINGQIYSEPLDLNKSLSLFLQNFNDFAYKPDESKCYVLRQNFNSFSSTSLEEYNLPSGKISKIITPKVNGRFVIYNNKAYIFGTSNNSIQQTILQKIQL